MSDVEFDEDKSFGFTSHKILGEAIEPSMSKFFRKIGIVKNGKQAEHIMISVIIICIVISCWILFGSSIENVLRPKIIPQGTPVIHNTGIMKTFKFNGQ